MIEPNKILEGISAVDFEGKDVNFFKHIENGNYALIETITKSAEEWLEDYRISWDTIVPESLNPGTNYNHLNENYGDPLQIKPHANVNSE